MNTHQQAYCDGAAMAYRDVAEKIKDMIEKSPSEIKPLMEIMRPLAESVSLKAKGVYEEAERIEYATRN